MQNRLALPDAAGRGEQYGWKGFKRYKLPVIE